LIGLPSPNAHDNERKQKRKSRAYIAYSTLREGTIVWEVELSNGIADGNDRNTETTSQQQSPTAQTVLKRRRTRSQEEVAVSNLILASMLNSCELINDKQDTNHQHLLSRILNREGDSVVKKQYDTNNQEFRLTEQSAENGACRIIEGKANVVAVLPVGEKMSALYNDEQIPFLPDTLIVPGSFNPPHIGHVQLANAAVIALRRIRQESTNNTNLRSRALDSVPSSVSSSSSILDDMWNTVRTTSNNQNDPTVLFEISVTNADKPPIDPEEVERRVKLFSGLQRHHFPQDWGVILTNAPLFAQKASVLDNLIEGTNAARKMTFVIGEFVSV